MNHLLSKPFNPDYLHYRLYGLMPNHKSFEVQFYTHVLYNLKTISNSF